MQDTSAAWLMTSLSTSALMVSLVQSASSLPFFFLALPAGALADIVDRRRLLIFTQSWMLVAALALGVLTFAGLTSPWVLLCLTFFLYTGNSLNQPAWSALTPDLVPREEFQNAVTLNGIANNLARSIGPALAGVVLAVSGAGVSFTLNALSFLGVIVVLVRWKRPHHVSLMPSERLFGAMRAGVRYVRHSQPVQAVLMRTLLFIVCASAFWALLPQIARREMMVGSVGYGTLLTAFGLGAISCAYSLPALKRKISVDASCASRPSSSPQPSPRSR
jgi:MFS family permease